MGSRQGGATLYDHALLADRKTSIGKAWLAATLGRTSGLLKWKRGELESVNIPKTWCGPRRESAAIDGDGDEADPFFPPSFSPLIPL